jgi:hypothetical protein
VVASLELISSYNADWKSYISSSLLKSFKYISRCETHKSIDDKARYRTSQIISSHVQHFKFCFEISFTGHVCDKLCVQVLISSTGGIKSIPEVRVSLGCFPRADLELKKCSAWFQGIENLANFTVSSGILSGRFSIVLQTSSRKKASQGIEGLFPSFFCL